MQYTQLTYKIPLSAATMAFVIPMTVLISIYAGLSGTGLFYFIEGIAVTFFSIMAIENLFHQGNRLRIIIGAILAFWAIQHMVSVVYTAEFLQNNHYISRLVNALDMTATPTCAFLMLELCIPGWLTWRKVLMHELPFLVLGLLSMILNEDIYYYMLIAFFVMYGVGISVAVLVNIPRYNKMLKEHYSYDENVNLKWLYLVLCTFFVLMLVYALCSTYDTVLGDLVYLFGSVASWAWICYCIQRQESVFEELNRQEDEVAEIEVDDATPDVVPDDIPNLDNAIREHFIDKQLYLNPTLKLSDMAIAVGTNRTYLSRYINEKLKTNFYDYVNSLRLSHATKMIENSDLSIQTIALVAGFNSYSTFRRTFIAKLGQSPQEYRTKSKH